MNLVRYTMTPVQHSQAFFALISLTNPKTPVGDTDLLLIITVVIDFPNSLFLLQALCAYAWKGLFDMPFDSSSTQNGLTEYCLLQSETLLVEQVTEIHKEYKKYNHKLQNSCCKYKSIFLQMIANLVTSSPQAHRAVKKKSYIYFTAQHTLHLSVYIQSENCV